MVLFMIINLLSGVNPSVVRADETTDTEHFLNYNLEKTDNATGVKLTQKASNYNNGSFDVEMTVEGNEDSTTKMHSLDVVLAIDTSNSMNEEVGEAKRLDTAKKAAVSFVNGLILDGKTNVRVSVIGYGAHAYEVIGLSNKKADIVNAINSLTITGGTYTQDALKMSDSILSKSQADQKRIVLLSDGVPTYGYDGKNSGFDNAIETDNNITHPSYKIYHRKVTQKEIPVVGGFGKEKYGNFIEGYNVNKEWVSDGLFKRYRFQNYRVYPGRIGDGRKGSEIINNLLFSEANKIKGKDIIITTVGIDVYGDGAKILTEVAKNSGGYNGANGFGNNLKNILDKLAEEIINKRVNNGKFVIPMADFVKFKDNLTYEVTTNGKKNTILTNAIKDTKPTAGNNNLVFSGLTLGKDDKLTVKYKAELVEERKDGDYYNITKTSPKLFATATANDGIVFNKIMQVKDLKTVNLVINKKWVGSVPTGVDSVEFNILSNNDTLNDKAKVKKDSEWNTTVTGLPRYKGGNKIVYQLKEDIPQDATYEVSKNERSDAVNGDIIFNVTNKNTEKVDYVVTKKWGNTPSELQFATNVQLYDGENKVNNRLVTLKDNNWTATFTDLPKYNDNGDEIKYSVKEVGDKEEEKEGKLTLQGYEYSVKHDTATESNQDTITNTVTNASKKTFTAKVTKKWEGGISTNSVKFNFTNKKYSKDKYTLTIEPNEGNEWNGNIELPKYNDDISEAEYTVEEVTVPGFTTTGGENKVVTADAPDVVFTNKINTRDITVTKDWGATPAEFIKDITVVLTGEAEGHKDIIKTMTIPVGEKSVKFTVPTHTRDGKKINYTASEQGEKDGIVTIDGKEFKVTYPEFNKIVNTYTGLEKDVVKLTIIKKWEGEGRVPVKFEVKDENGEKAYNNIALNSDPWTDTVELPMWDKATGKLKTYTVNEVKTTPTFDLYPFLKEDENIISGKDKTVTFTNIRVMRKLELEKEWIGEAAGQAKFKLDGSGVSKEFTLTKDKNWKENVDLPVYDLDGNVINYTITEESIEGYNAVKPTQNFNFVDPANGIVNRSVKFTNFELLKPQFTVHKTWVGEPASKATFGLFADGKSAPVDTLELTGENAKPLGSKVWEGVCVPCGARF